MVYLHKCLLFDIGSSTIKCCFYDDGVIKKVEEQTIDFKEGTSKEYGISIDKFMFLKKFISKQITQQIGKVPARIYATGIFRKINSKQIANIKSELYVEFGLNFNVISHELENFYLEKSIELDKYSKKYCLLNIGGDSTELVFLQEGKVFNRVNFEIGVGTIINLFPYINEPLNEKQVTAIKDYIVSNVQQNDLLTEGLHFAIYTGGELNYMEACNYPLTNNLFFMHEGLPKQISLDEFINKNKHVFFDISLEELKLLMPSNPNWMNGARACSLLAQSIFEVFHIPYVIPSNANLLLGVAKQEFKKVVICGSYRKFMSEIENVKRKLEIKGVEVLSPVTTIVEQIIDNEFVKFYHDEEIKNITQTYGIEKKHMIAMEEADSIIVCNKNGYIGDSTKLELGGSLMINKNIIFLYEDEVNLGISFPKDIGILD